MEQPFLPASPLSVTCFLFVVAAVLAAILCGARRADRSLAGKVALFLVAWLGASSAAVLSGILFTYPMPGLPLFMAGILACALGFALSPWGAGFASLPLPALIAFQSFRLPLELVLHDWAAHGTVPPTMTWTGQNLDVLAGILALAGFTPIGRNKAYAWFFALAGSALLLNVMRVVILSSPFPFAWPMERPLQLALHMPYALIATVCVWAALAGHAILFRKLARGLTPPLENRDVGFPSFRWFSGMSPRGEFPSIYSIE